jgi:hypothetical protein
MLSYGLAIFAVESQLYEITSFADTLHHIPFSFGHHGMSAGRHDLIFVPNKAVTGSRSAVLFSLTIKPSELQKRSQRRIATRI